MSETVVEKQVRLLLEQQCAELFMRVLAPEHRDRGLQLSLFCFEYGDEGNVAFKTSLSRSALHETVARLVASPWATGGQRFVNARYCMSAVGLKRLHDDLKAVCPAGVGFALLVGLDDDVQYIASAERAGVAEIFQKLVERWKGEERSELS